MLMNATHWRTERCIGMRHKLLITCTPTFCAEAMMTELEQKVLGTLVGALDDTTTLTGEQKVSIALKIMERMDRAGIKFMVPSPKVKAGGRFDRFFMWAENQKGSTVSIDDLTVEGTAKLDPLEDTMDEEEYDQMKLFRRLNTRDRHKALAKYYKERGYEEEPPAASEYKLLIEWLENHVGRVTAEALLELNENAQWTAKEHCPEVLRDALCQFKQLSPESQQRVIMEHYADS